MRLLLYFPIRYLSSKSHLGGTKESSEFAVWISNKFKKAELDNIMIAKYNVLVSYPEKPGNKNR